MEFERVEKERPELAQEYNMPMEQLDSLTLYERVVDSNCVIGGDCRRPSFVAPLDLSALGHFVFVNLLKFDLFKSCLVWFAFIIALIWNLFTQGIVMK